MAKSRIIIVALLLVLAPPLLSQNWYTIHYSSLNFLGFRSPGNSIYSRQFSVNPYDNTLWFAKNNYVQYIKESGEHGRFDYNNVPVFHNWSQMEDFAFTKDYVFITDNYKGLFKYDGITFNLEFPVEYALDLCAEEDSIWMTVESSNYFSWKAGLFTQYAQKYNRRLTVRNGQLWGSTGTYDGISHIDAMGNHLHSPDTSVLLDWSSYDFKFARNSDTLFVSGDRGFSLAYDNFFRDTITANNSTNMPSGAILEFEFDQNDNIWALFGEGNGFANFSSLAYFDRSTRNWSQIYNNLNCPIDFTKRLSIELDTLGNLWVCGPSYLYLLELAQKPAWVGLEEQTPFSRVELYPNPVNDQLFIDLQQEHQASAIRIVDVTGREYMRQQYSKEISVSSLQKGVYFLLLYNEEGKKIAVEKFVKE